MRASPVDVLYDTVKPTPTSMVMRALPSEKTVLPSDALGNEGAVRTSAPTIGTSRAGPRELRWLCDSTTSALAPVNIAAWGGLAAIAAAV